MLSDEIQNLDAGERVWSASEKNSSNERGRRVRVNGSVLNFVGVHLGEVRKPVVKSARGISRKSRKQNRVAGVWSNLFGELERTEHIKSAQTDPTLPCSSEKKRKAAG